MKLKKLVSLVLSTSILVGSVLNVNADEVVINDVDAAVEAVDVVESPAAAEIEEIEAEVVEEATDVLVDAQEETQESLELEAPTDLEAMAGSLAFGWTGSGKTTGKVGYTQTSDGVILKVISSGNGKVSDGEDSVAYYGVNVPEGTDFVLKGKMSIDAYNTLGSSNPQQSSFGAFVFDEKYSKDGGKSYVNSIFLMKHMAGSSATTSSFVAASRNNASTKTIDAYLEEGGKISGNNLGTHDIKIVKSGDSYMVQYDDKVYGYPHVGDMLTGDVFTGFFVARDATVTISELSYTETTKKATALRFETAPSKTSYILDDTLALDDAKVIATYDDGSEAELTDYVVAGFDTSGKGAKTMSIIANDCSLDIPYEVFGVDCTKINLVYPPIKTDYYEGMPFSTDGMEVTAEYGNGETAELDEDTYELIINGTKVKAGDIMTKAILGTSGTADVVVQHATTDRIETGSGRATFTINTSADDFTGIIVYTKPTKTSYYVGDALEETGIIVAGLYTSPSGAVTEAFLPESEFTVGELDSSTAGKKDVIVTSVYNPSLTAKFSVNVMDKIPYEFVCDYYPRLTYYVGESFDPSGLVYGLTYSDGSVDQNPASTCIYNANDFKTDAEREAFLANGKANNPYIIDVTNFDSSAVGKTSVALVPSDSQYAGTTLAISIVEPKEYIWKKAYFGQSTSSAGNKVTATNLGTLEGTVSIDATSGKITGDHDGIAYYYTRIPTSKNFTLSADISVRGYVNAKNDDLSRNGQEAFGLMIRDVIPLKPLEGDGSVTSETEAKIGDDGEPVVNQSNAVFGSNVVLLGGYSGTSWPNNPKAASYIKNTQINRINLYIRSGVFDPQGGGTKNGPYKLSSTFPEVGNQYHLTLQRINGGFYARCYDYQTGEVKETYRYFEDVIDIQNSEYYYVGLFGARYGKFDATNIEFHVSEPETDPIINKREQDEVIPNVLIKSNLFTTKEKYSLVLQATNSLGGYITIKQGNKIVYENYVLTQKAASYPIVLEKNSLNPITLVYSPSEADVLTNYDDVIVRTQVSHKEDVIDDPILYCAPDGKLDGDGTIDNPMDILSAIGFANDKQDIIALGGTYTMNSEIEIPVSNYGYSSDRKTISAEEGKDVILDFQGKYEGIVHEGDYWHFKGIDVTNTGENLKGFLLAANNCIIEDCKFYNNGDTGFQISRNDANKVVITDWPENNLIMNCESFNNADPAGINADGFGAKLTVGYGNVFKGCISHHNLDDGWDCYTKLATQQIGAIVLDGCISYRQGFKLLEDGTEEDYGLGGNNGYKMGGEDIAVQHYLKDCLMFQNDANGITSNSNPTMKLRNVIGFDNERNFNLYTNNSKDIYCYDLEGCVSYKSGTDVLGPQNKHTAYENNCETPIVSENNYWLLKAGVPANANGDLVTDEFFKSVNLEDSLVNFRYPQDEEGNFILGDFLARTEAYVHDEADLVDYTVFDEIEKPVYTTTTTEKTEATTKKPTTSGGGGGGGGAVSSAGGGSASTNAVTTVETTVADEIEIDDNDGIEETEATTEALSFTTPSGVVISPSLSTESVSFVDIASRPWAVEAIEKLAGAGIVNGVGNDMFNPDAYSQRGDFTIMLVKTLGLTGTATDNYTDVDADKYYANYIGLAKEAGITSGYSDGSFKPENTITRQDMMVLVAKTYEFLGIELNTDNTCLEQFADASEIADYAKDYVAALVNSEAVSGTETGIEPMALITRAQMSVLISNLYDAVIDMAIASKEEDAADFEEVVEEEIVEEAEEAEEVAEETEVIAEESEEATEEAEEIIEA